MGDFGVTGGWDEVSSSTIPSLTSHRDVGLRELSVSLRRQVHASPTLIRQRYPTLRSVAPAGGAADDAAPVEP